MPKHRKTLKEKKLADVRRGSLLKTATLPKNSFEKPLSVIPTEMEGYASTVMLKKNHLRQLTDRNNTHLMQDLVKTGIATAVILVVQVTLFFLLKKQILVLPMVKY